MSQSLQVVTPGPTLVEVRAEQAARERREIARAMRARRAAERDEMLYHETRVLFAARGDAALLGTQPEDGVTPSRRERLIPLASALATGVAVALSGGVAHASWGGFLAGSVFGLGTVAALDALLVGWAMQARDASGDAPGAAMPLGAAVIAATGAGAVTALAGLAVGSALAGAAGVACGLVMLATAMPLASRALVLARARHAHRRHAWLKARHEAEIAEHEKNVRQLAAELDSLLARATDAAAGIVEAPEVT